MQIPLCMIDVDLEEKWYLSLQGKPDLDNLVQFSLTAGKSVYSLHQKKVHTSAKAERSKARGTKRKVRGAPHLLSMSPPSVLSTRLDKSVYFLSWETVQLKC